MRDGQRQLVALAGKLGNEELIDRVAVEVCCRHRHVADGGGFGFGAEGFEASGARRYDRGQLTPGEAEQ